MRKIKSPFQAYLVSFLSCLALTTGCRSQQLRVKTGKIGIGESHRSLIFEKETRNYDCYRPQSHNSQRPAPLLFVLHGGGSNAEKVKKLTKRSFEKLAEKEGFVVVYPEAIENNWNDGRNVQRYRSHKENINDVGFINALIEEMVNQLSIDRSRVYVTGMSNGAMMTHRLALELSEKLAAVAPVSGALAKNLAQERPKSPVPILIVNGTEDPVIPFEGGEMKVLFRKLGVVLSADEASTLWRDWNECQESQQVQRIDRDKSDEIGVDVALWSGQAEVKIYTVRGGGHTWPGGSQYLPKKMIGNAYTDFEGATVIWDFFKTKKR